MRSLLTTDQIQIVTPGINMTIAIARSAVDATSMWNRDG